MGKVKDRIFVQFVRVFALTALILALSILIPGRPAQAAVTNDSLSLSKTYKSYDITNDGKKDTLRLTPGKKSSIFYKKLTIKVNGETAYTLNNILDDQFSVRVLTLSNNKSFLWVRGIGDDEDGQNLLLKYSKSSGKFKKVADFEKIFQKYCNHMYTQIKSVSGKKIVVNVQMCSYALGSINFDMTFTYKSGTLNYSKTMTNCKVLYGTQKKNTLTANKNFTAYSTKKLSGKKYTIKKNKKVKIVSFYLTNAKTFEYKMSVGGKTRWKKFEKSHPSKNLFKNLYYYG